MYADYDNCTVNLSCSILKEFRVPFSHSTLKRVDTLLEPNYRNVVLLVLGGFGIKQMQKHLSTNGFFGKNFVNYYSSVFPPSAATATASLLSALNPSEHGIIGRNLYFPEYDAVVDIFTNEEKGTGKKLDEKSVVDKLMPYESILDKINKGYVGDAYYISKYSKDENLRVNTLEEMMEKIVQIGDNYRKNFIYAYWHEPDELIHKNGTKDLEITGFMQDLEQDIEEMIRKMNDTILLITSDHGFIDVKYKTLTEYPDLTEMLERQTALEDRTTAFYVKEEYIKEFPKIFTRHFGSDFFLYSKAEAIESQLFGPGVQHKRLEMLLGDYIAVAITDKAIRYSPNCKESVSDHSGMTESEMQIPLIAISKRRGWF